MKILGDGEIKRSLVIHLPCSGGAEKKIKLAGGTIDLEIKKEKVKNNVVKEMKKEK